MKRAPGARLHAAGRARAQFKVKVHAETAVGRDVLNRLFPSGEVADIIAPSIAAGKPAGRGAGLPVLQGPEVGVQAISGHQVPVRSFLMNTAFVHDQDPVKILHAAKPVRNEKAASSDCELEQALQDVGLCQGVQVGGRLVQDQERRVLEDDSRDSEALPFAGAQGGAVLADERAITFGQGLDEIVEGCLARRPLHIGEAESPARQA